MPHNKMTTNIIIRLKELGHSDTEIVSFLAFIETHDPSEEEAKKAIEGNKQ